jgi:dihydrofolate reductase
MNDEFAHPAMDNFGAFILGRNRFGPVCGPWSDGSWRGWWGNNPPYPAPTFVLTHQEREPLVMEGGTTFCFVTGGIDEALARAKKAAGSKDVKIGGGVSTVRQYPQAGLIDSVHLALVPVGRLLRRRNGGEPCPSFAISALQSTRWRALHGWPAL